MSANHNLQQQFFQPCWQLHDAFVIGDIRFHLHALTEGKGNSITQGFLGRNRQLNQGFSEGKGRKTEFEVREVYYVLVQTLAQQTAYFDNLYSCTMINFVMNTHTASQPLTFAQQYVSFLLFLYQAMQVMFLLCFFMIFHVHAFVIIFLYFHYIFFFIMLCILHMFAVCNSVQGLSMIHGGNQGFERFQEGLGFHGIGLGFQHYLQMRLITTTL